ncbi:epidermal growth factor-like protein 8 [Lytechinus variegatus]|uniref:epidermal growth factor-like protein 8 n=1 Tax=Lytechinus variegatus TaxID=7654 RepID=UPI001BB16436|nr:epidermal growth factor-like protein 8 [Lytechinus variegatus]
MVTVPLSDYSANVPVDHGERFNVTCNPGYSFDSASYLELSCDNSILSLDPLSSCNDIDECTLDSSLCTDGRCFNLIGNYTCICNSGFVLTDLHSCTALPSVSNVATSTASVTLQGAKLNGEALVYSAELTDRTSALFIELELQYCVVVSIPR